MQGSNQVSAAPKSTPLQSQGHGPYASGRIVGRRTEGSSLHLARLVARGRIWSRNPHIYCSKVEPYQRNKAMSVEMGAGMGQRKAE